MNNPNVYYTCKDTGTQIVDGPRGGYDVVYNGTPILNLPSLGPGSYMAGFALDTVEDAMFEVAETISTSVLSDGSDFERIDTVETGYIDLVWKIQLDNGEIEVCLSISHDLLMEGKEGFISSCTVYIDEELGGVDIDDMKGDGAEIQLAKRIFGQAEMFAKDEVARVRYFWTILPVEGVGYGLTRHGSCQLTVYITDEVARGVRSFVYHTYGHECYESKVFFVKTTSVHNETANLVVHQTSRTTYQLELQISGYTYLFVPRLASV